MSNRRKLRAAPPATAPGTWQQAALRDFRRLGRDLIAPTQEGM